MSKFILRDGVLWRQLTCCLVIYTLIIQALLLGFLGAQASASLGGEGPGYEYCLNGDHGPDDAPHHGSDGNSCVQCLAGAQFALEAPPAAASWRLYTLSAQPLPPLPDRPVPPQIVADAAPRGPPLTA